MDVYFKKDILYPFEGQKFGFEIANNLFSSFDLDHGTDILLRSISKTDAKSILDIGCGYGPIGIILAKNNPQAQVILTDRDLLAVRYANINIKKNGITNATAIGGLGVESVSDKRFDLIVSNIPAKIGDEAIAQEFIWEPFRLLSPGGEYWFVVVSGLNRLIPALPKKYDLEIKEVRKRNGHTVYKITKR